MLSARALLLFMLVNRVMFPADTLIQLRTALVEWSPVVTSPKPGLIVVKTQDRSIDMAKFAPMVSAACKVLSKTKGVNELQVVNFSGKYGMAFENPSVKCSSVLSTPLDKRQLYVSFATHTLP